MYENDAGEDNARKNGNAAAGCVREECKQEIDAMSGNPEPMGDRPFSE